jgi:hypothetical protein
MIEELLENYALYNLMQEYKDEELLEFNDAKDYYNKLNKTS